MDETSGVVWPSFWYWVKAGVALTVGFWFMSTVLWLLYMQFMLQVFLPGVVRALR